MLGGIRFGVKEVLLHCSHLNTRGDVGWGGVEWGGVGWSGVEWSGVEWSGVEYSTVRYGTVRYSTVKDEVKGRFRCSFVRSKLTTV